MQFNRLLSILILVLKDCALFFLFQPKAVKSKTDFLRRGKSLIKSFTKMTEEERKELIKQVYMLFLRDFPHSLGVTQGLAVHLHTDLWLHFFSLSIISPTTWLVVSTGF